MSIAQQFFLGWGWGEGGGGGECDNITGQLRVN